MSNYVFSYQGRLEDEERHLINEVFGEDVQTYEQFNKGVSGGAIDIHFIVDLLRSDAVTAVVNVLALTDVGIRFTTFVARLFKRNDEKIMDKESRKKNTIVTIRLKGGQVSVSNMEAGDRLKMIVSKTLDGFETYQMEYDKQKVEEIIEKGFQGPGGSIS